MELQAEKPLLNRKMHDRKIVINNYPMNQLIVSLSIAPIFHKEKF